MSAIATRLDENNHSAFSHPDHSRNSIDSENADAFSPVVRLRKGLCPRLSHRSGRHVERRSARNRMGVGLTVDNAEFPSVFEYRLKIGRGKVRARRHLISPGFNQAERAGGTYFLRNVEKYADPLAGA
jgi:hypothetical protein